MFGNGWSNALKSQVVVDVNDNWRYSENSNNVTEAQNWELSYIANEKYRFWNDDNADKVCLAFQNSIWEWVAAYSEKNSQVPYTTGEKFPFK